MDQASEADSRKFALTTGAHLRQPDEWATALRVETLTTLAPNNAVKAEALSVFVGKRCLFSDTNVKIAETCHTDEVETPRGSVRHLKHGTCYGLVGPNGCGKSTMLAMIAQRRLPVPSGWDVFHVSQQLPSPTESSLVQEVLGANAERVALHKLADSLEDELVGLAESDAAALAVASAQLVDVHSQLGRWADAEKEVEDILLALGFQRSANAKHSDAEPCLGTPMVELSGGWRMKIQLAKALWLKPKLLLLDEPTNHLDFETSEWLAKQLSEYPHTTIVVSHDVAFLQSVCREILWVNERKLKPMPREMVSQQDLARMQRIKALKMEFSVPEGDIAADHGLSLHGVQFGYNTDGGGGSSSSNTSSRLWKQQGHVRFSGRSRSVVLGKNGSGKSSFLKLCVGKISPTEGAVDRTPDLKIGYFTQHLDDFEHDTAESAAAYLVRECREALATRVGRCRGVESFSIGQAVTHDCDKALQKRLFEQARGVLSDFGFEGDLAIGVPVQRLSGGQKACLKFAHLSLHPAHILFLDEPTNHLDAEACAALAKGLSDFKGGIVVVTHDELLMYRLIQCNWAESELLVCQDGKLKCNKDFGTNCLKTLKDQVRNAERTNNLVGASSKRNQIALEGHQAPKMESVLEKPGRMTTTTKVTPGIPPWLAQAKSRKEKTCQPEKIDLNVARPLGRELNSGQLGDVLEVPRALQEIDSASSPNFCKKEGCEEVVACVEVAETNRAEQPRAVEASNKLRSEDTKCSAKGSCTHSRLRKDLVNLNKAVAKWRKQLEKGDMTQEEIALKIRTSVAARQLRALHAGNFDEESFVQETLGRGSGVPQVPCLRRERTPIGGG